MRFIALAAAFTAAALATPLSAETWTCKLTPAGTSHAIPNDVILKHGADGSVVVIDNVIQHYVGQPIAGMLKSKNANRVLFGYTVPGIKNSTGQYTPGIVYTINIQLPSGKASMTGKPQGYSNSWRGSGACTQS